MKALIALLILIPNICLAAPFAGAWYESSNDIGFLIHQKGNKLQAILKTNSGCKHIYTKMRGLLAEKEGSVSITLTAYNISMPNECSMELIILLDGALTSDTLIVSKGSVISAVRCNQKEKVDASTLDRTFFNRISTKAFFGKGKPKLRNEI